MLIPSRLIRTIPERHSPSAEKFWAGAKRLHPGWSTVTYQDPIEPAAFPRTSHAWPRCTSGAQFAGLVRLEALWWHGGIYLDSDVEVLGPLDEFLTCGCFAAWEDDNTIPDAILGATAQHPAIDACINLALERLHSASRDWRTGNGAWSTGPGVTTTVLSNFDGVTIFGPERLYPVHYTEKALLEVFDPAAHPDAVTLHHWHGSWL